jgi:hypothetical protein
MKSNYPTFDQAIEKLAAFARSQVVSDSLIFITPEDIILYRGIIYIKIGNEKRARQISVQIYNQAVAKDMGVMLGILCTLNNGSCAFVGRPKDENEAERLLYPRGLKLSIAKNIKTGQSCRSIRWWIAKLLESPANRQRKADLFR